MNGVPDVVCFYSDLDVEVQCAIRTNVRLERVMPCAGVVQFYMALFQKVMPLLLSLCGILCALCCTFCIVRFISNVQACKYAKHAQTL